MYVVVVTWTTEILGVLVLNGERNWFGVNVRVRVLKLESLSGAGALTKSGRTEE